MPQSSLSPSLQSVLEQIIHLVNFDRYAALNQCELGLTQARAAQDDFAVIAIAIQYGLVIDQIGYPEDSIHILNEALFLANKHQSLHDEARLLNVMGRAVYTRAEYRRAMQIWAQCLDVATRADDPISWIWAKLGIAQIYDALHDHRTAVDLLQQAQARAEALNSPSLTLNVLLNLGVNLFHCQAYSQALLVYQQALVLARELNHLDDLGELLFRIAEVEFQEGRMISALTTLDEAQGICIQANHIWGLAHIHGVRAQVLAQQAAVDEALEEIKMGIDYATAAGAMHIEMRLLEIQSELAERQYQARKRHLEHTLNNMQLARNDARAVGSDLQLHELQAELSGVFADVELMRSASRSANRLRLKISINQQQLAELGALRDVDPHD